MDNTNFATGIRLTEIISKYWGFMLFIIGLVFHALWTYFRVDNHTQRIIKLEDERENTVSVISRINERLSGMDGKLDILVKGYKHDE